MKTCTLKYLLSATFSGDGAKCPESVDKGVNVGVPVLVLQVHAKTDLEMFCQCFVTSSIFSTYRGHQSGYEGHFFFESQEWDVPRAGDDVSLIHGNPLSRNSDALYLIFVGVRGLWFVCQTEVNSENLWKVDTVDVYLCDPHVHVLRPLVQLVIAVPVLLLHHVHRATEAMSSASAKV